MERLQVQLKVERDSFHDQLKTIEAHPDNALPKALDPSLVLEPDLHCESIESTPMPYVLNVGCGFRPWSMGRRTKQGVPIVAVGIDPLAFGIGEALKLMTTAFPFLHKSRCFMLPIVGEEASAAFPPSTFNAVWSDGAILDSVDPFRFLQQCVRATKVGGVVCVKLGQAGGTLWTAHAAGGAKVIFTSDRGGQEITEIRGERVEVHTMLDGGIMLKIRRREHTPGELMKKLQQGGLVLPGVNT